MYESTLQHPCLVQKKIKKIYLSWVNKCKPTSKFDIFNGLVSLKRFELNLRKTLIF